MTPVELNEMTLAIHCSPDENPIATKQGLPLLSGLFCADCSEIVLKTFANQVASSLDVWGQINQTSHLFGKNSPQNLIL